MIPVTDAELILKPPRCWLVRFEVEGAVERTLPVGEEAATHLIALLATHPNSLLVLGVAQSNDGEQASLLRVEVRRVGYAPDADDQIETLTLGRDDCEVPPPGTVRCPHCGGHGMRKAPLLSVAAAHDAERRETAEGPHPHPRVVCPLCRGEGAVNVYDARRYARGAGDFAKRVRELEQQAARHVAAALREGE